AMPDLCVHTHLFPTTPEGDLELCNGQPGSAAADWLRRMLIANGIPCRDLIQEDYGWGFWLEHDLAIWVSASYAGGTRGSADDPPQWWFGAAHERPNYSLKQRVLRDEGEALEARVFA